MTISDGSLGRSPDRSRRVPEAAGISGAARLSRAAAGGEGLPGSGGELRRVARVVLLDPDDRILLMHGFEPDDPAHTWWFTPGGGLEGDETREEAALRELVEETGITEVELGPVLWRRTCSFPFAGRRWDQDEWYFLARTAADGDGSARSHGAGATQCRGSEVVDLRRTVGGA